MKAGNLKKREDGRAMRISGEVSLWLAWVIALFSSFSVLFIGEVLGQTPCALCWFQRAFMFPLVIVLGLGIW